MAVMLDTPYCEELLMGFNTMRKEKTYTDFAICVGEEKIPCHRLVLSAASPYFAALLTSGMKEVQKQEVSLDHLDPTAVKDVIDYMYSGKIKLLLNSITHYVECSEYLQIISLRNYLQNFICESISENNMIYWFVMAGRYNLTNVRNHCASQINFRIKYVCHRRVFKKLPLCEVLSLIKLNTVRSCDDLLDVYSVWLQHDKSRGWKELTQILQQLYPEKCTLGLIEHKMYKQVLKPSAPMKESLQILQKLRPKKYPRIKCRDFTFKLIIGGESRDRDEQNKSFWCIKLDAVGNKAQMIHSAEYPLPENAIRDRAAICSIPWNVLPGSSEHRRGALFVAGGTAFPWDESGPKKCTVYDIRGARFVPTELPDLPTASSAFSAAVVVQSPTGLKVFVVAGLGVRAGVMEYLDMKTKRWQSCARLILKVTMPIAAAIGENVYVLPNIRPEDKKILPEDYQVSLQCYDSNTDSWHMCCPMPLRIKLTDGACAVSVGSHMYVLGGKERIVERYCPDLDNWQSLEAPMKRDHIYGQAFALGSLIFVVGGWSDEDKKTTSVIEMIGTGCFNMKKKWKTCGAAMPKPLWHHFVCPTIDEDEVPSDNHEVPTDNDVIPTDNDEPLADLDVDPTDHDEISTDDEETPIKDDDTSYSEYDEMSSSEYD